MNTDYMYDVGCTVYEVVDFYRTSNTLHSHRTPYIIHRTSNIALKTTHMTLTWSIKKFEDLTPNELYHILRLRSEVFVVEQQCIFLDADNKDQVALHCMCWNSDSLFAYSRLLPPGFAYEQASIGRVVTAPVARKLSVGKELMKRSVDACTDLFKTGTIKIGAQFYLKKFYASFGFEQSSEVYLEDGIEHIEMILIKKIK